MVLGGLLAVRVIYYYLLEKFLAGVHSNFAGTNIRMRKFVDHLETRNKVAFHRMPLLIKLSINLFVNKPVRDD